MKTIELIARIDTGSKDCFRSKVFIVDNYFEIQGLKIQSVESL